MCKSFDLYLNLLNKNLKLHQDIIAITLMQYDIIEKEDYDELDLNLKKRDKLTYELISTNKELGDIDASQFSSSDAVEINKIRSKIVEIRQKVVYHDNVLKEKLIEKREEYKSELKEINLNRQASRKYNLWGYKHNSSFFDKRQ